MKDSVIFDPPHSPKHQHEPLNPQPGTPSDGLAPQWSGTCPGEYLGSGIRYYFLHTLSSVRFYPSESRIRYDCAEISSFHHSVSSYLMFVRCFGDGVCKIYLCCMHGKETGVMENVYRMCGTLVVRVRERTGLISNAVVEKEVLWWV